MLFPIFNPRHVDCSASAASSREGDDQREMLKVADSPTSAKTNLNLLSGGCGATSTHFVISHVHTLPPPVSHRGLLGLVGRSSKIRDYRSKATSCMYLVATSFKKRSEIIVLLVVGNYKIDLNVTVWSPLIVTGGLYHKVKGKSLLDIRTKA